MIVKNADEIPDAKLDTVTYRNKPDTLKEVWIRWLSHAGSKDVWNYGLRLFTVGPNGTIPIHNHRYLQTMYVLTGSLIVFIYNPETDLLIESKKVGPSDVVFVSSMEPHSAVNPSESENCTFLCCIGNALDDGIL